MKRGIGYRVLGIGKEENVVYEMIFSTFCPYTRNPKPETLK